MLALPAPPPPPLPPGGGETMRVQDVCTITVYVSADTVFLATLFFRICSACINPQLVSWQFVRLNLLVGRVRPAFFPPCFVAVRPFLTRAPDTGMWHAAPQLSLQNTNPYLLYSVIFCARAICEPRFIFPFLLGLGFVVIRKKKLYRLLEKLLLLSQEAPSSSDFLSHSPYVSSCYLMFQEDTLLFFRE